MLSFMYGLVGVSFGLLGFGSRASIAPSTGRLYLRGYISLDSSSCCPREDSAVKGPSFWRCSDPYDIRNLPVLTSWPIVNSSGSVQENATAPPES